MFSTFGRSNQNLYSEAGRGYSTEGKTSMAPTKTNSLIYGRSNTASIFLKRAAFLSLCLVTWTQLIFKPASSFASTNEDLATALKLETSDPKASAKVFSMIQKESPEFRIAVEEL